MSYVMSIKEPLFEKVDEGIVDGELWHSIGVRRIPGGVYHWLLENGMREHGSVLSLYAVFDIPDELYTLMVLRWS